MTAATDETGNRRGRLVVISRAPNYVSPSGKTAARWNCKCDCGTSVVVTAPNLRNRPNISCGCFNREFASKLNFRHGGRVDRKVTPEHSSYRAMLARCLRPSNSNYVRYGAAGIRVCNRWLGKDGYLNFLSDLGPRPSLAHTLDRIDSSKNYEPANCRWATITQQNRNRRSAKIP